MVCDSSSTVAVEGGAEEEWVFHADHSSDSDSRHSSTSPTPTLSHKRKRHKRSDSAFKSESSSGTFQLTLCSHDDCGSLDW